MRTTLKLISPLIVSVVVVSLLFAAYQVRTERRILRNDLSRRAEILGESLQESVEPQFDRPLPDKSLQRLVDRFGQREHLKGVAVYIDRQVADTLRDSLVSALVQTLLITGLALILVRWTLTGPLNRTAKWLRTLRTGQSHAPPSLPEGELFDQLHHEVTHLARDLSAARASAEEEARLRNTNASLSTAERLRVSLSNKLQDKPLFVIDNRVPYDLVHSNGSNRTVQVIVPASGLVTALEPLLLATHGTWIAHGSGNAHPPTLDAQEP